MQLLDLDNGQELPFIYNLLRLILNHYRFSANRDTSLHAALSGLILNSFLFDLPRM
jgi:hypothetical protein